jgi:hypothetical protein
LRFSLRGEGRAGGCQGRAAEPEVVQDAHGILAVLAGGVEVAADVEPVLGGVVAGLSTSFIPAGPGPQRRLVMPRANTCPRGSGTASPCRPGWETSLASVMYRPNASLVYGPYAPCTGAAHRLAHGKVIYKSDRSFS